MPLGGTLLLRAQRVGVVAVVEFGVLHRANCGDLGITPTQFTLGIKDGVDVQARSGRTFARNFTETKNQLLLQVVGKVILPAEEDYATLRD